MKIFASLLAATAVVIFVFAISAQANLFMNTDEELTAKFVDEDSRFLNIDGVRIRYKDEGNGDPIFLIHGAYGNLNMWDEWVEILKADYRIIRIDNPPEGLSGPDPSGRHGHDRNGELVGEIADTLGLDRFAIGGTSRGAVVAYRYAAKHQERVSHLILVNTPVLPQESPPPTFGLRVARIFNTFLGDYETRFYWSEFLKFLFYDPSRVTDELVDEYMSFNNRVGKKDRMRILVAGGANRDQGEISQLLGSISAPTLIIASETNAALALEDQKAMERMFASTVPEFHLIKDGGHLLAIEKGNVTGTITKSFLDTHKDAYETADANNQWANSSKVTSITVSVPRPAEQPDLTLRVTVPNKGNDLPIVVFSHGNRHSGNEYRVLTDFWAANGFIVVQPTHLDSESIGLDEDNPLQKTIWSTRIADIRQIADNLNMILGALGSSSARVDMNTLIIAGHSFGGHTTQAIMGAKVFSEKAGTYESHRDDRFAIGLIMAGPGNVDESKSIDGFNVDWSSMAGPVLTVSGMKDVFEGINTDWSWHSDSFTKSAPGQKYLAAIPGAGHYLGGIQGIAGPGRASYDSPNPSILHASRRLTLDYLERMSDNPHGEWRPKRQQLLVQGTNSIIEISRK